MEVIRRMKIGELKKDRGEENEDRWRVEVTKKGGGKAKIRGKQRE